MEDGLITLAVLEDLAGTTAFRRGEDCFSVGAVGRLRTTDDKIAAKVEGTETCQVELRDAIATVASAVPPAPSFAGIQTLPVPTRHGAGQFGRDPFFPAIN